MIIMHKIDPFDNIRGKTKAVLTFNNLWPSRSPCDISTRAFEPVFRWSRVDSR